MTRYEAVSNDGVSLVGARTTAQTTVLASAARTATPTKVLQSNPAGHRGIVVVIDCTAVVTTPSVVFTIQGYSPLGDDYYTILASAAVTGTGQTVLRVFPGLTAVANTHANDIIPPQWAVDAVHGDADSITYSVAATLIP